MRFVFKLIEAQLALHEVCFLKLIEAQLALHEVCFLIATLEAQLALHEVCFLRLIERCVAVRQNGSLFPPPRSLSHYCICSVGT